MVSRIPIFKDIRRVHEKADHTQAFPVNKIQNSSVIDTKKMRRASLSCVPETSNNTVTGIGTRTKSQMQIPQPTRFALRPATPVTAPNDCQQDEDPSVETSSTSSEISLAPVPRNEASVRVAVRVRPLLPKEIALNTPLCVQHEGNSIQVIPNQKQFTYDVYYLIHHTNFY